jgi:hypothetical protein
VFKPTKELLESTAAPEAYAVAMVERGAVFARPIKVVADTVNSRDELT